ncbi:MAG TPA: hypothetical protein V6C88_11010 [Chroococcidiopsis sp.]
MLYRLAEELPQRCSVDHPELFAAAATVIMGRRDSARTMAHLEEPIRQWLDHWATWAHGAAAADPTALGAQPEDLGKLLRFTAFWVDKMVQRQGWQQQPEPTADNTAQTLKAGG